MEEVQGHTCKLSVQSAVDWREMEAAGRPNLGALLRQFRLDAGMTQQGLAERAKLSVEAISLLERGARTRPQRETLLLLGRALALSPEREALLNSAIGIAHPPRRRSESLNASLLRIVRPDTQAAARHNLPQQLTSFVGRQREVGEIAALLREHRLVTVVGAGGVGKTRVVVQLGSDSLDGCPDGAWLVDLAPLADQTLVASSVLTALHLPSTTESPSDVVVAYLKTRRLLLILDNCEHVIAAVREVAASIVQSCPYVSILTTSRAALEAPGELVYRLPSMPIPPDSRGTAQDALRYGAVALFVDRAHAVNSSFALIDDNAPDVSEICRHLDGIPLAIELAAARVKVLAPRQIAQRLDRRFRLLTGGDSGALPRHQTMTALIDWSYDLLTAREQCFFESLSTFGGSCNLDAATAVCAINGEDDLDVIDLIASLVTKSLLVAKLVGTEERYYLLESSRQYAWDKLLAHGEQERISLRHALFYSQLSERLDQAWNTTPDRNWLPRAQVESENWRTALNWALASRSDTILGQTLAASRKAVLLSLGPAEGRRWIHLALQVTDELTPPDLVARLQIAYAESAHQAGEHKTALAAAERALLFYREARDLLGIAQAQVLAGKSLGILGRHTEAEHLLSEALATARALGDRRVLAITLQAVGNVRSLKGEFAKAREYLTEAFELANALGAEFQAASLLAHLGSNEYDDGDPEAALRFTADAIVMFRGPNHSAPAEMVGSLASMAPYLIASGRYDEARVFSKEALEFSRELRLSVFVTLSLLHLVVAILLSPSVRAARTHIEHSRFARLCGFIDASLASLGVPAKWALPTEYPRTLTVLREAVGTDDLAHLMATGAKMTEDEAIAQAQALE
jgi:predicted ATPase/DNA-binding XRE family transcriptional regulator